MSWLWWRHRPSDEAMRELLELNRQMAESAERCLARTRKLNEQMAAALPADWKKRLRDDDSHRGDA